MEGDLQDGEGSKSQQWNQTYPWIFLKIDSKMHLFWGIQNLLFSNLLSVVHNLFMLIKK